MESEKVEYLRKRFRESPSSEKKIKFSDIKDDLISQFPSASWNARIVSETVRAHLHRPSLMTHSFLHSGGFRMLQRGFRVSRTRAKRARFFGHAHFYVGHTHSRSKMASFE